jgi:hypothetical protein
LRVEGSGDRRFRRDRIRLSPCSQAR